MPTYEYECDACGHAFEEFQMMTAKLLKKCPKCGKRKLNRLIGAGAAIIFKGSGFYETDYKRSGSDSDGDKSKENKESKEGKEGKESKESASAKKENSSPANDSKSSDSKPSSGKD